LHKFSDAVRYDDLSSTDRHLERGYKSISPSSPRRTVHSQSELRPKTKTKGAIQKIKTNRHRSSDNFFQRSFTSQISKENSNHIIMVTVPRVSPGHEHKQGTLMRQKAWNKHKLTLYRMLY